MYNNQDKEHLWVKAKTVFKFIKRCKDLKYILKSKIVFKRYQLRVITWYGWGYLETNFNKISPG